MQNFSLSPVLPPTYPAACEPLPIPQMALLVLESHHEPYHIHLQLLSLCTQLGVDDMDVFKGIELRLQAFERLLERHPEFHGQLVLVQVSKFLDPSRWGT